MKKKIIYAVLALLLLTGAYLGWQVSGPTVQAPEGKYFYIKNGSTYEEVRADLLDKHIIGNAYFFDLLARQARYKNNVRAGRYEIKKGMSLLRLVRMLRAGQQSPVNFVITKLRTREDLAQRIAASFETDSATVINFLNNKDSLQAYHLDSNTVMTAVIPNTYAILWNTPVNRIFRKLYNEREKFWTPERQQLAAAKNMTPLQVYTMASIVEEETNKEEDKGNIASVYINRVKAGQRLEADPTIKFALRNFGLKRIRKVHIDACATSPYNTYYAAGLPPGPICTPSSKTIDAVLNAPATNYLFFVARPDWSGLSNFTESYTEHMENARKYQRFLDSINIK